MKHQRVIKLGIAGASSRGAAFRQSIESLGLFKVQAVCDIREETLETTRVAFDAPEKYVSYDEMIAHADIEAVLIGTPMPFHAPQAIGALKRDIHVLCEVTAAVSIEEARQLAAACQSSSALYMMGENYTFTRPNMLIRALVQQGLFGETYYAEGEYLHELKHLFEETPWRRDWQVGRAGVTYGTHSLGPILQWMPGDRVVAVMAAGSGQRHRDLRGAHYEQDASSVMLGKTAKGALIKIRMDIISDRPHAMTNYSLQGLDGCYESARAEGERNRIWLRARYPSPTRWENLEALEADYLPEVWRTYGSIAQNVSHGGGDFFELLHFYQAVTGQAHLTLGIHEALDMTLPGLISQQSMAQGGIWLDVPDSRAWIP